MDKGVILHECAWILASGYMLYAEQWMLRAFISGDYRYTVISTVLPWLYCLVSSVIVFVGLNLEITVIRKYYIPYGYLRSLYLVYRIYQAYRLRLLVICAWFVVVFLIGLIFLRHVSRRMVNEEYMDAFKPLTPSDNPRAELPETNQQPKHDPFYTPPPPPKPPAPTPSEWYCTECGKANTEKFKFCGRCGTPRK